MSEKKEQITFGFIDDREPWEIEWQGMPEYSQEDQGAYRTLYIHFTCKEDVDNFAKKIDQKIYPKEKSYWFPKAEIKRVANKIYVEEEDES